MQIYRVHRTGKRNGRCPVDSVSQYSYVPLGRSETKNATLKAAGLVKPEGLLVNEDLAAETIQRRES